MPRPTRIVVPEWCYHFINRANKRAQIFHTPADYDAFIRVIAEAQDRCAIPILGVCLMPNHVHLVVRPVDQDSLSRWAHWAFTAHTARYNAFHGSSGHVWQGRYKIFATQTDQHLLTVLRYVERNALRGKLVERAEHWNWGSLCWRNGKSAPFRLTPSPAPLPNYWTEFVNQPQTTVELEAIRNCVNRQRPFGGADWVTSVAERLRLRQALVPRGRPRKKKGLAVARSEQRPVLDLDPIS